MVRVIVVQMGIMCEITSEFKSPHELNCSYYSLQDQYCIGCYTVIGTSK